MSNNNLDNSGNTKKAKLERQKIRTSKNKAHKAARTEKRRVAVADRRKREGWNIKKVGSRYSIYRNVDDAKVLLHGEEEEFPTFSAAYKAARGSGQPAKMIS